MNLLIVESPAKAKTIGKYLGNGYKVISSYGHVRALPSEEGAVDPEHDFAMRYEVLPKASKQLAAIIAEAKTCDNIYLATDPDREGEAISWHIMEMLRQKKAVKSTTKVHRAVFYEITKKAILESLNHTRSLDESLVNAQQTRQALDYLVGFTLSPVLWRKLPGSKSAGRVQSVALRVVCEREAEIERFHSQEYWSIKADFANSQGDKFSGSLIEFNGDKLSKLSIKDENQALSIVESINGNQFTIKKIEKKQMNKNPHAPFSTSTMLQEAARKLGFSAKKTSQVAQKLYEGVSINGELTGLITYMRTDSTSISTDAANAARQLIAGQYGENYMPSAPRVYKTKAKNAQEAHEAIRPTDVFKKPSDVSKFLEEDQLKLYELIWNRLVASQMANAILDVMSVDIADAHQNTFRANGSSIAFMGFYKIYKEGLDDSDDDGERLLPSLYEKEVTKLLDLLKTQHFTQPPPRYTEASLVKKMEELGIGRPSTYPSIISILQTRKYVLLDKKRFMPEMRGRLVNSFLTSFFQRYVEYDFTAHLENELDEIAAGKIAWKKVMEDFWQPFKERTDEVLSIKTPEILEKIEHELFDYIFHKAAIAQNKSLDELIKCEKCTDGKLKLKNGRFGSFLACSNYPSCNYTKPIGNSDDGGSELIDNNSSDFPKVLGIDPDSKEEISIRKGPYGIYLQKGEGKKVKRVGLLSGVKHEEVNLEYAIGLLSLPRNVGLDDDGMLVKAGIGKFGPYLEKNGKYFSLKATGYDALSVTLDQASGVIKRLDEGRGASKKGIAKKKINKGSVIDK